MTYLKEIKEVKNFLSNPEGRPSFYIGFVRFTASLALQVEPEYQTYLDRFPLPK